MGRAARPLHDPGNHGSIERGSNLHAARRGSLRKPARPAGERENTAALTPSPGTRSYKGRTGRTNPCFNSVSSALPGTYLSDLKRCLGISDELNRREILTANGGRWHATTVANLLRRT